MMRSVLRPITLVPAMAALCIACGTPGAHAPTAPAHQQPHGGAIAGTVRDGPTGTPLSFATVTATAPGGDPVSVSTGANGGYRIDGLQAGRYNVVVYYAQQTERMHNITVGARSTTRVNLAFGERDGAGAAPEAAAGGASVRGVHKQRSSTGGIRGTVLDGQTKQRLPGAVVAATTPKATDALMAIADEHGHFVMPSLPPGVYALSVYYHLSDRGTIEVRRTGVKVNRGEFIEIDLVLDVQPEL